MKNLFILMLFFVISTNLFGQSTELDSIYTRNGKIIVGKVKEIGTTEIKYTLPQISEDVINVISKDEVEKIVYPNHQTQIIESESLKNETIENNSQELFQTQRKNALKIDFLAIAANTLTLTYERCLQPGRSVEFSGGFIGTGIGLQEEKASGILLKGGYKFARNPDYYIKGMRYAHILKGAYIKLEFDFASYSVEGYRDIFEFSKERYNNTKWAFLLVFGDQWVFNDKLLVDVYSGIGIGDNSLKENVDSTYPYGFATLGDEFPLAMSLGLRLGLLIK